MAQARGGNRVVYFVDASHFVLASFLGWVWCFVRLYVRAASGRQRYNVLGALNAGMSVLLGGHTGTERGYLPRLKARLEALLEGVNVVISATDVDPLVTV